MSGWLQAVVAGSCMFAVNVLATVTVIAESARRAWLAASVYTVSWLPSIIATAIAVEALDGKVLLAKALVLVLVSAANLSGTVVGTKVGAWLLRNPKVRQVFGGAVDEAGGAVGEAVRRRKP